MPVTANQFVSSATSSNTFEIETSRLAAKQTRNAQVRRFASQMIRDHGMAGRQMAASVRAAGLPAEPAAMDSRHEEMMRELSATPRRQFDARYVEMQVQAHDEAVTLFSNYAERGDQPALVSFARETLPKLQEHADRIRAISDRAQ
jgi:putative membrane protein